MNWNEDTTDHENQNGDRKVRFDVSNTMPNSANTPAINNHNSKMDHDDLFAEEPVKNKIKNEYNDDLFAEDESPKQDKDFSDDPFGSKLDFINTLDENDDKKSQSKGNDFDDDDDDPFGEAKDVKAPEETPKTPRLKSDKSTIEAGDLFTKQLNFKMPNLKPNEPKQNQRFRYFGELKDADSIYQIRYESHNKMKLLSKAQSTLPLKLYTTDKEIIKIYEKKRLEDVRNHKLIESKVFERLSLYNFRNKRLEKPLRLGLLTIDKYSKMNHENRVEKISLILDSEKKCKDLNFTFEENMDKMYDNDIREIMKVIDSKRSKDDDTLHFDLDDDKINDVNKQVQDERSENKSMLNTNDIDDISSIDSDTKEEEKKFKIHDGVLSNAQNMMSNNVSDLLQHAKCFTFEYLECDYDNFHRPDLAYVFSDIEYDKHQELENPYLSTEAKLKMTMAGSLSEYQKKEKSKLLSLKMVLQSNIKLKKKLKSK